MTIPMPTQERIRTLDADGMASRQIATRLGISRNTVAKYVNQTDFSPAPPTRQPASLVDAYANIVEGWLIDDLRQPRKQRHTGRRVFDRLVAEYDFSGSYATVQRWVKRWRQSRAEAGEGFIELDWEPGTAQADFGEADAIIQGKRVTTHMLVVTWPYSNTRYAVVLPGETAECVCQGLRTIFELVGRVPVRMVFDNATGIGKRINKEVRTTKLFDAFKLHYRFTATFTNPNSGNEKGSVENAVGYIRRNALVPVPHVETYQGLSEYLLDACDELLPNDHYRKDGTIGALFDTDLEVMRDLPGIGFDACTWLLRRVDKVGNIDVTGVKYFVGTEYAGQRVHVGMRAFTMQARTLTGETITTHTRVYGGQSVTVSQPEQLLAGLIRKPGAFLNSPLGQSLPDPLLGLVTEADPGERRRLLGVLRQATGIAGFDAAVTVMNEIVQAGRAVEASEVEMVATRAREQPFPGVRNTATQESSSGADLRVYEQFTKAAA